MQLARLVIVCGIAAMLAACGTPRAATVTGGEKRAIEPPRYEVKGKTPYDQQWIDETVEAGVAGLGWDRPAPRPAELDRVPAANPIAAPKKKKRWFQRATGS